eukprot:s4522_g5.t1
MVGQKDCVRSNAHLQQAATSELFDQEESAAKDTDEDNRLCELNEAVCRNLHFPSDILREEPQDSSSSSSSDVDDFGKSEAEDVGPPPANMSRRRISTDVNMELLRKALEEKAKRRQEAEEKKQKARFRRAVANFMDGPYMTLISVCLTFWALLGDDIRILTTNRPADIGCGPQPVRH